MKNIKTTIKLKKFKEMLSDKILKENPNVDDYYILYRDGTYEETYFKDDLIRILKNDNNKPIRYIFDANDRIILNRDIEVYLFDKEDNNV